MSRILEQYTSAGGVGVNTVKKMAQVRNAVKQMRVMWLSLWRRPVSFSLHLATSAAAMAAGSRAQTAAIAPPVLILTVLLILPLTPLPTALSQTADQSTKEWLATMVAGPASAEVAAASPTVGTGLTKQASDLR